MSGKILLGSININSYKLGSWREYMGIVPQNFHLFNTSILNNITCFESNPNLERVVDICNRIGLTKTLEELPSGIMTHVGSNGEKISGGESQKIAFARVLYRNPQLFILDEITSFMDEASEALVLSAVKELKREGKIVVMITHSQKQINISDQIIRLKKCFEKYNCFQDKKYNIFLVSIPSGGNSSEGLAKLIGISDDYKEIDILKSIFDYKGLVNAIEINLNNKYYLLSCTKGFKLWYYNLDTKDIESKEIIPKKKDNNDNENNLYKNFRTFKELIFIENRKLLIAQVNFPDQFIYFYNINDDNNSFNIFFLAQIKINKKEPYFSSSPFNSCLIKDKYLLIGTKADKIENKNFKSNQKSKNKIIEKENNNEIKEAKIEKAGIYIINLDIIFNDLSKIDKTIQINYFDYCKEVYCISHIRENMFVCTYKLIRDKKIKQKFCINTYEIIENNGMININKKYYKNGIYKNINSSKLINDSFIICSNTYNNQLLKIDKNGEIYYYFDIRLNNKF